MMQDDNDRIRANVARMRAKGASNDEVDDYLSRVEGLRTIAEPTMAASETTQARVRPPEAPRQSFMEGMKGANASIAHGMTLGFADEIGAGVKALMSGHPVKNFEEKRRELEAPRERFAKENPVANFLGETAGGAALMAALPFSRVLKPGASVVRKVGAGVATGAGIGGVAGAGAASGGVAERAKGGARGAVAGAAIGGLLPVAGAAGGLVLDATGARNTAPIRALARVSPVMDARQRARQMIVQAMERDQLTLPEAMAKVNATHPQTIMDLAGENTMGLGRGAQSVPGRAKREIADRLHERSAGASSRVKGELGEALGVPREDAGAKAAELAGRRSANAQPAYEAAYMGAEVSDPAVLAAFDDPAFAKAYAVGRRIAKREGNELPELAGAVDETALKGFHGSPKTDLSVVQSSPTARQYDNASSQLGAFFSPSKAEAARYSGKTGKVYSASVPLRNPREMTWGEFSRFQDPTRGPLTSDGFRGAQLPQSQWARRAEELKTEAAALRKELEAAGHDGIIVRKSNGQIEEIASFRDVPLSSPPSLSIRAIDYAKRGLDDLIDAKMRGGKMGRAEARSLRQKLDQVLATVDASNPEYAAARKQFAGDSRLIEAHEGGTELSKTDPDEVARIMGRATPDEQQMYRSGAHDNLVNRIESTAGPGRDMTSGIYGSEMQQNRMSPLFSSPEKKAKWDAAVAREKRMNQTKNFVTGGPATARIQAEQTDLADGSIDALASLARSPTQAGWSMLQAAARRGRGLTEGTANELSPLLTAGARGPGGVLQPGEMTLEEMLREILAFQGQQAQGARRAGVFRRTATGRGAGDYAGADERRP